jgi:S1-C subfamily serine protease
MVINSDGLVLTNNHVIEDSTAIRVTVAATGRTYQARVIGYDKTGDIALIQLQNAVVAGAKAERGPGHRGGETALPGPCP